MVFALDEKAHPTARPRTAGGDVVGCQLDTPCPGAMESPALYFPATNLWGGRGSEILGCASVLRLLIVSQG